MRAAALRDGGIVVRDDLPEPTPSTGDVLVQVRACGICGSDLHFARHGATMMALTEQMKGMPETNAPRLDLEQDVFLGHEFVAEVLEAGPDTDAPAPGTLVTSIPALMTPTGVRGLVYNNDLYAGYGERMLLSAPLLLSVPAGLDAQYAALTEPMAVGLHAVNRSAIAKGDGALVLGCGPIGLAVIASLRRRAIEPIVASDFSPARRRLAEAMGAHVVCDPAVEPAFDAWRRTGGERPLVVFEAIGVPGIIDETLLEAPLRSRIVVVGVCMERDAITPYFGIGKELSVHFVLGYDPDEFSESLTAIAEGELDVAPLITGQVGLDGVAEAFSDLADPERHCKVLVTPDHPS